jgi:hypothetical protein
LLLAFAAVGVLGDRMRTDVVKWHDVIVSAGIHQ